MYLAGQLPYGPESTNTGGIPNFTGQDILLDDVMTLAPADSVPASSPASGSGTNQQNTYLLPGGSPDVVPASIANGNGIVQYPVTSPGSRTRFQKLPGSPVDSCGGGSGGGGLSGLGAVDPATCTAIQCGTISQASAGMSLIEACADAGYAGVKACTDPACDCPAPPAPQSIISASPPAVASPAPPAGYVTPSMNTTCGGYAASSVLPMLANNAGRGMGSCCQSGYQQYQSNQVSQPDNSLFWWLAAGVALLMLTPGGKQ